MASHVRRLGIPTAFIATLIVLRSTLTLPFEFRPFFSSFGLVTLVYLFAFWTIRRNPKAISVRSILVLAFLGRAIFFTDHPILSTDVYRYIWDGHLLLKGLNPLAFSPNEALLTLKADPLFPPDHRDIASVYPLLSLIYFALLNLLRTSPLVFGFAAACLDTLSTSLLCKTLRRRGLNPSLAILFAWHPLMILESAHSGHVDSLGIFFLSLAIYLRTLKPALATWALVACGLTKLWPASFLAADWKNHGKKRPILLAWIGFGVLAVLPWLHAGTSSGLTTYGRTWEFNAALFSVLNPFVGNDMARIFCLFGFAAAVIAIGICRFKGKIASFESAGVWICGALILASPTVHPWYTLWLLPFLVFEFDVGFLSLTLAVVASYAVLPTYLAGGSWSEASWPRWVTYSPFVLFMLWKFVTQKNSEGSRTRIPPPLR